MAIVKQKLSQLPPATDTTGLQVFGFDTNGDNVRASMELLQGNDGQSAFDLWLSQPGNSGKTYQDYLDYNRQPATDAASTVDAAVQAANEAVDTANAASQSANTAVGAANTATDKANAAAGMAQTAADNANAAAQNANNAASVATTAAGNVNTAISNAQTATDAANAAAENADTATSSANKAAGDANAAAQNANTAAGSASAAVSAANAAAEEANAAAQETITATENANTATNNANEATTNANAAATAANTAAGNIGTAVSDAQAATLAANTATDNANAATTAAQTATTEAQTATTAANDAANNAANAADTANASATSAQTATDDANAAATAANEGATAANTATGNANTATQNSIIATEAAVTATGNAETAAEVATLAASRATTAASNSEILNSHQPVIQSGETGVYTWWVWDLAADSYVDTGLPSRGQEGKPLKVSSDGYYMYWDDSIQDYVKSDVEATATVDIENVPVTFAEAETLENIETGLTVPAVFSRIMKWFSSFGSLAWKSKVNYTTDIDNSPVIPAKTSDLTNDSSFQTGSDVDAKISSHNTSTAAHNDIRGDITTLQSDVEGIQEQIINESHFRGYVLTTAEVQAIQGTPNDYVYNAETGTKWVYSTENGWTDSGVAVPDQTVNKSTTVPLMDGTATIGNENAYAAGNHRHPTDTTRASVTSVNQLRADVKSKSKSVVLQSSSWSQSGSLYRQLITDADIVDGSVISGGVDATDTVSYDAWTAAEGITGVFDTTTAGQFYVYAKTAPTVNINYKYTISL